MLEAEQEKIHSAPQNSGPVILGQTLPALLDEACDRVPNHHAFNQWHETGWQSLSNEEFRLTAEAVALGLLNLGLQPGDRVALLMHSDVNFCIADFGCLLASLVDVPIDLTQTIEHILYILRHSEAKVLFISNLDLLTQIVPYLGNATALQFVIIVDVPPDWQDTRSHWHTIPCDQSAEQNQPTANLEEIPEAACLDVPALLHPVHPDHFHSPMPECVRVLALNEIRIQELTSNATLTPDRLATIIYIPDESGQLQGVMLSQENLSANALAAFADIADLQRGAAERVLTFLPLNHVLARCLLYGHINYGHCIYFSTANRVSKHLKEVQPTILVTVPLFLEKIYSKILEKGSKSPSLLERIIFQRSLQLAKRYELGKPPQKLYKLLLSLADWLVLSKWRSVFGGRLKHLISGGAALNAELANVFAAAGVTILQGYGLTQASAVVCYNRNTLNRAGTVGVPIAGAEVMIAPDSEILIRGPYITPGYYKNPAATQAMIDAQGWLHTGDLGRFTTDGFLQIIGLKKALFKLSTGKYIAPHPIELRLQQSPFVAQAIVVGSERKFCAALIVPDLQALHRYGLEIGLDLPPEELLQHSCIQALYQAAVEAANCHLPYWSTVKRFRLIQTAFTVENGLLTTTGEIDRAKVISVFAPEINALYREEGTRKRGEIEPQSVQELNTCPPIPAASCPVFAQSLNPRLTT
jgi:long-chain acyl-CoA synthetase